MSFPPFTWPPIVSSSTQQPAGALLAPVTVYVNSATGNDLNPGTASAPFATLLRAWQERQKYAQLRARFAVQLIGVGPYDMPTMSGSDCGEGGYFVVMGDRTVDVVTASGTATGDMVVNTLPTSANGGVDNRRNLWLRFTSGAAIGCLFQITSNTANTITVAQSQAHSGRVIANGDTFDIVSPATVIRVATLASGAQPELSALTGTIGSATAGISAARHIFYGVSFAKVGFLVLACYSAAVSFGFCLAAPTLYVAGNSVVQFGLIGDQTVVGVTNAIGIDAVFGAGFVGVSASARDGILQGVIAASFGVSIDTNAQYFGWWGGVIVALVVASGVMATAFRGDYVTTQTAIVSGGAIVRYKAFSGTWTFVITAGSCWNLQSGGLLDVEANTAFVGGTSDAAGFGVDVRNGGRAIFSILPTLTGGTAGADLRSSSATAANAALAAVPSGVAVSAQFGQLITRAQ